jgi:indolepyruvate ferredoxin oxidoreductase beta subunit
VHVVPGVSIAEELGNARAHNVVVLGSLSRHLDAEVHVWERVIAELVPERYVDLNLEAFARGRAVP